MTCRRSAAASKLPSSTTADRAHGGTAADEPDDNGHPAVYYKDAIVVLPIFGPTGQPEYQIEIHVSHPDTLTLDSLNTALENAQNVLAPSLSAR